MKSGGNRISYPFRLSPLVPLYVPEDYNRIGGCEWFVAPDARWSGVRFQDPPRQTGEWLGVGVPFQVQRKGEGQ